jgi:hypothetical protein
MLAAVHWSYIDEMLVFIHGKQKKRCFVVVVLAHIVEMYKAQFQVAKT